MIGNKAKKSKDWKIIQPDLAIEEEFCNQVPASRIVCRVLLNRGIRTPREAREFLNPSMDNLHDPSLLDGIDRAVARTIKALDAGEKIMVHGDYDVDGITSTALLVRVLRALRADVSWYIPHRQREGYDIRQSGIEEAARRGANLIITVDCGTSAIDEIEYAKRLGIDVIVTDHHEPGPKIAEPLALINPRKRDCQYPFKDLAGVGVAFKFAEALVKGRGYDTEAFRRRFVDLVAIGTVADIVPLVGENRVLTKCGITEIPRSGKPGIQALLKVAGVHGKPITSHMLSYILCPRLNAAGRLDDASLALNLLLTKEEAEAEKLAEMLELQNRERQREQERITLEAIEQITGRCLDEKAKVLVLSSQRWHPGIIGVVASKIVDLFHRPAVLIAIDEANNKGVGSARSIDSFHLFKALMQCSELLERCGGHAKAAGLSIMAEKLSDFDEAINEVADHILTQSDLIPQIEVDAELEIDEITYDLATELQLLEPFGYGNREPVFASRDVRVISKTRLGGNGNHLKLKLATQKTKQIECIAFGWGESEQLFEIGATVDLCYNVQINEYAGFKVVQLVLKDAKPSKST
ncbi:MAG: single-stranded-DNA-specific exonuclease RecJ [Armatimonadetes bacterium]|nr:single-stranded-DNA-specific exonuclease RecJ [Armatimonadota bacterium]